MKQKKYEKPSFNVLTVEMNDLCAGSQNVTIPLVIKKIETKKTYSRRFEKGDTNGMWDTTF